MHPWHPDAQALSPQHLLWAALQAREDAGKDPRGDHAMAEKQARDQRVAELVVWADAHLSGGA